MLAPLALMLMIAGCGTSNSSGAGASTPASSPAKSTSASSSSTGGAYGAPASGGGSGTAGTALITTKHDSKLGTILAFGSKRLTVYLFEADKPGSSSCMGACARAWPPVTGSPKARAGAMDADLGTITRPDGTKQVTYKGHPLYLFVKDKDDGDAYGEGVKAFGAEWYALEPSGNKVDLS